MNALPKKRLGRGLAALIGDEPDTETPTTPQQGLRRMAIDLIRPNPQNPRRAFSEEEIQSLSISIKDKGLLQPILVRPMPDGSHQIVAGERRWRAAQVAGLHEVSVIVRELDDKQTLEIAIVENVQRQDLNALEEAMAYRMLIDQYDYTQQQLADSIGKSRSHIANTLRLTTLPDGVQKQINDGLLSAGHARALVATENPQDLAQKIIALGLSVRQAEDLTRNENRLAKTPKKEKDADTRALEKALANVLGLAVDIKHKGPGGELSIRYKSLEQLEDVSRRLGAG
jgi:ParB family transcriptional regulator, chromosome partitioning protein